MVVHPISEESIDHVLSQVSRPFQVLEHAGTQEIRDGVPPWLDEHRDARFLGYVPACRPEDLGDSSFCADHGLRYACVAGAMANGIASVRIVEEMARAGMLGVFGAAGLDPARVERAIDQVQQSLGQRHAYGFNLIHSPSDPALESAIVDLYVRRGVRLVEASAFLDLTLPVVRYRVAGIRRDSSGQIVAPNRIIAKVSRVEVATKFMSPPPAKFLRELVATGVISAEQAEWAGRIPMADDLTAEADSGGHTDNQPAVVLLPTMLDLRDRLHAEHRYRSPVRVGAAGGIATPWSAVAAFAMGAAYLVTGSINQSCVEAGTSDVVRRLLCQARQGDVAMAPAADMFEMGVKVQVLKRGTMFPMRAAKLFEIYRANDGIEQIPASERANLEKSLFKKPLETVWHETRDFFTRRDPSQLERADRDPKHKMALIFRWYLGNSSNWANSGDPSRTLDYQIWCGPAMAAFNDWVRGSFLEVPENRRVSVVALNLLYGAAVLTRARMLQTQGGKLPPRSPLLTPLESGEIENRCSLN
ncbi:MAG: 2-nitropropane dioxygenase [Planctomycetes bacterium SCN 63-9]|nr:MAG: 2-nitropropane dioxygenase [Planctomycetes bacterium SCN 63-9]